MKLIERRNRCRNAAGRGCLAAAALLAGAAPATAQLRESQVLVVYDSRIADSLAVAEYYAGSARVPGGFGNRSGMHPTVRTVNLADLPGAGISPNPGNISYPDFIARFRDPLRSYLTGNGLVGTVRCLVMTKGLPHRVQDINSPNPNVGDQPQAASNLLSDGNLTYASVDSELTLLWQNLSAGEGNGFADSKADGGIANPYFKASQPITAFSTQNIVAAKTISQAGAPWTGILWRIQPGGTAGLTPGDMYLVCRLDGNTVADVMSSIQRAQNLKVDLDRSVIVLDESNSDGIQGLSDTDGEFDNDGSPLTNNGDDYEQTRDFLLADSRFAPANVRYDPLASAANFLVGPLVNFGAGSVVNGGVLLLATYGANHAGTPPNAGTQYPFSFIYQPGAAFNTIESFNGRSFGGIGIGFTPQAQLADFIQAGGTFGVGYVWEPFSYSVADNVFIARNFYLGGMTWAEAAWSSIPLLSWQHVVVGDPLARVTRTKEDINSDDRTDVEDLYGWFAPVSRPRDLNRDARIDRKDTELLRDSIRWGECGNMRPEGGR